MLSESTGEHIDATVIAVRPRRVVVRIEGGDLSCELRKGLLTGPRDQRSLLAVGDCVRVTIDAGGTGVLQEVLPRRSKISRLRSLRPLREHVIAANVDQLLAIQSVDLPRLNRRGLDRLIVVGEVGGVECAICLNKIDLLTSGQNEDPLAVYGDIGYPVFCTCATGGIGLDSIEAFLSDRRTLLIGPSGVGKTTLLNQLIPGLELRTGEVSTATRRGIHTTARVDYLELPGGGVVLDSPGLRAIQPWIEPAHLAEQFPEMRPLLGACHFRNCLHRTEPGCAIRDASQAGTIDAARYDSYVRMIEGLLEENSGPLPDSGTKGE